MITQRKIAEKAGLSYATVSRAFTHSAKVSADTLKRIRNAMNELGIQNVEDFFAERAFSSRLVLVIVSDISRSFYANIVIGLSNALSKMGYSIVLCNSKLNSSMEIESLLRAQEYGYAGIVMVTAVESQELVSFLQNSRIAVVLVNRYIRSLDLDVVRIDNYRGGYLAAQHLVENGHKEIAVLCGPQNSSATEDRLRGFRDALADLGLPFDGGHITYGDLSRDSGKTFAGALAAGPYTAAFICNDYMAAGAVHQLLKLGKRIPDDISIICFDDSPLVNEDGLNLTCLCCDPVMMGESAAKVLLHRMAEPLGMCEKTIYTPKLIQRGSVKRTESVL